MFGESAKRGFPSSSIAEMCSSSVEEPKVGWDGPRSSLSLIFARPSSRSCVQVAISSRAQAMLSTFFPVKGRKPRRCVGRSDSGTSKDSSVDASTSVPFLEAFWMASSRSLAAMRRSSVSADSSLAHAARRRS